MEETRQYWELHSKYEYSEHAHQNDPDAVYEVFGKQIARAHSFHEHASEETKLALKKDPFSMHTDQQLDDELLLHIQTKIAYTYRDLKKMRYYKRVDPFSLRYRVEAIQMGYYDLSNDENRILGHVTDRMWLTELQMSKFVKFSTSIFLVMSQAMRHMLENTTERWRKLFSSKD